MVLLKVLLVTLVSCQVIIYGGAISLNRFRSGQYHGMSFSEFTSNEEHESVWDSPTYLRSWMPITTQRALQLTTSNKEYGSKFANSQIFWVKFFTSADQMPWDRSDRFCKSVNMTLASPQNKLQMHKLQAFLDVYDSPSTDGSGYWLGGRRKDDINGNDFYWTSNGKKISDELWSPSKPTAYEGRNCVEFKNWYDGMKLNNFYCEVKRRCICQEVNHYEYRKNSRVLQLINNITRSSHQEVKKISNEGTASASGKENSPTMTTTNASTNITSHQTSTTTTSTTTTTPTTTTPTTTTSTTTPMTTTPITTKTQEYYLESHRLLPVEDPFQYEYDE